MGTASDNVDQSLLTHLKSVKEDLQRDQKELKFKVEVGNDAKKSLAEVDAMIADIDKRIADLGG